MIRAVVFSSIIAAGFAASGAGAETINTTFMKCAFEDESTVVLSESGDFTLWNEGPMILVATHIMRAAGMPLISIFAQPPDGGASLLSVYAASGGAQRFAPNKGVLIRTYVEDDQVMAIETQGRCEAIFPEG